MVLVEGREKAIVRWEEMPGKVSTRMFVVAIALKLLSSSSLRPYELVYTIFPASRSTTCSACAGKPGMLKSLIVKQGNKRGQVTK